MICYFFITTAQFKLRTWRMMRSMCLFLLLIVLCFTNFITQCRGQNEAHLEDLLSDLMTYFQSKSIVIHSNKMNVFKSKTLQGYVWSTHIELPLVAYCSRSLRLENIVTSSKYIINQRSRNARVNYYCILMMSH